MGCNVNQKLINGESEKPQKFIHSLLYLMFYAYFNCTTCLCIYQSVCFLLTLYSFIHPFIHSFIHLSFRPSIHLFIYSFVHSFIFPFVHLFIYSFIHSYIHSFIFPFVHLFIYSFIHSFIHSYIHSYFSQMYFNPSKQTRCMDLNSFYNHNFYYYHFYCFCNFQYYFVGMVHECALTTVKYGVQFPSFLLVN